MNTDDISNGRAAAAIFSAAVGCFLIGLFFLWEDASPAAAAFFRWYPPAGALSGVSTAAVIIWLTLWAALYYRWKDKHVRMFWVNAISFALLLLSLLLTFPPFIDFLQGK